MCSGGALLADFEAGTSDRPCVPDLVERHLTQTADGVWVVWARKAALRSGDVLSYAPITGVGGVYPRDAVASCRQADHAAPQPTCTCGFHALGDAELPRSSGRGYRHFVYLDVALSGRVLAFAWPPPPGLVAAPGARAASTAALRALGLLGDPDDESGPRRSGVLFRAERQTVMREFDPRGETDEDAEWRRWEAGGSLARLVATQPRGAGPRRLRLPVSPPPVVELDDHAGACGLGLRFVSVPTPVPALSSV